MVKLRHIIAMIVLCLACSFVGDDKSRSLDLTSVVFADAHNGYAIGSGTDGATILKTSNGGISWTMSYQSPHIILFGLSFRSSQEGWAVGSNGRIIATLDGGLTWNILQSGTTEDLFAIVARLPSGPLFAVGKHGTLLSSVDDGKVWAKHVLPTTVDLTKVALLPSDMLLVLGKDRLLTSRDYGAGWTTHGPYRWDTLFAVSFVSEHEGFLSAGPLLHTSDGGITLQQVVLPTNKRVIQICTAGPQTLFAVSGSLSTGSVVHIRGERLPSESTILKSADSGKTWEPVFQLSDAETSRAYLTDIFFLDGKIGWAVGYSGTLVSTVDAGKTWREQRVSQSEN